MGAGLAVLRKLNQFAMVAFRRHCMITLKVSSKDKSYHWLLMWISANAVHTQHLSAETSFQQLENGSVRTRFDFVPSPGIHFMRYGRTWIRVEWNREKQMVNFQTSTLWETVTLMALGRNRAIYFSILEEGVLTYNSAYSINKVVYACCPLFFLGAHKLEGWLCTTWKERLSCILQWVLNGVSLAIHEGEDLWTLWCWTKESQQQFLLMCRSSLRIQSGIWTEVSNSNQPVI